MHYLYKKAFYYWWWYTIPVDSPAYPGQELGTFLQAIIQPFILKWCECKPVFIASVQYTGLTPNTAYGMQQDEGHFLL